ncbi:hypothetical protein ACFVZD_46145 [Streptomyces sp. NPDC058287]|uniref:hypothetical protein n=1 Tax=Streptomyces sp. NPDC058287 TaxID=3346423 RepID=UPI0036E70294
MTTTIMARPGVRAVQAANPEYACESCGEWHTGPCSTERMHRLVTHMVRHADGHIPAGRRARRTLQEMAPGYERQPVLILHRPTMSDDSCPLCHRWSCDPSNCPPRASTTSPAPVASGGGLQCDQCGGVFGAVPGSQATLTAWTCGACRALLGH